MTKTVNADGCKDEFNQLRPDDMTQAEFLAELLDCYRLHGDAMTWSELVGELNETVGVASELGAYRGSKEAIQDRQ